MPRFPSPDLKNNISISSQILIAHFDRCSLTPKLCANGRWIIGYGSNKLANGTIVTRETPALTQEQAENLLRDRVCMLQQQILDSVIVPLKPCQIIALLSFTYHVEFASFADSLLHRMLNEGKFDEAADQFLHWDHINGHSVNSLVRRRHIEHQIFLGKEVVL